MIICDVIACGEQATEKFLSNCFCEKHFKEEKKNFRPRLLSDNLERTPIILRKNRQVVLDFWPDKALAQKPLKSGERRKFAARFTVPIVVKDFRINSPECFKVTYDYYQDILYTLNDRMKLEIEVENISNEGRLVFASAFAETQGF